MIPIIRLPRSMQLSLESTAQALLQPPGGRRIDFSRPFGEAALVPPDSTSWRIFKNPIALLVGGMAAVILELAQPAARRGGANAPPGGRRNTGRRGIYRERRATFDVGARDREFRLRRGI